MLTGVKYEVKAGAVFSFAALMRIALFFCLFIISAKCFSQQNYVAGIVFDKNNHDRIASVNIRNITNGKSVYNSLKGEFKIEAATGDVLVFSRDDFHPDTVKVMSNAELAIYMDPLAIQLRQVTIHDTLHSPESRLAATKSDYSKIYGPAANRDLITSPSNGPAGLSIDALYNSFSRSGRNAEHLRGLIENDYKQNVIDYRFNRTLVGRITGLKDEKLTLFMQRYRPGYFLTRNATEYEFIASIKANYKRFLRYPRRYVLPALKKSEP